jgi:N-acetyl-anhydromuramyl-L-alanine amidase AmpD
MEKYHAADELFPSKTDKGSTRTLSKINSIIIHTTGYGVGLKRINERNTDELATIGSVYAKRMSSVLKYKGHFLIDHVGIVYHFIPLDEVAWHTGSSKRNKLKKEKPFDWWALRWKEMGYPTELPSWEGNSPNKVSVGIDLLAHGNGAIVSGYTDKQYESLARLIKALCADLEIPVDRKYIVGHEDVDPISRGSKKAGWDPGKFDYDRLLSLISIEEKSDDEPAPKEVPIPRVTIGPRPVVVPPPVSIADILRDLFRMFWHK